MSWVQSPPGASFFRVYYRLKIDASGRSRMDGWDFFIPSIGIFVGLNVLTCIVGIRQLRLLERRVFALEERPAVPDVERAAAAQAVVPTVTAYSIPPYVSPNVYTYSPQLTAPPPATYYQQDPQALQPNAGYRY